jgi:uncharacterized protein (TIGR03086 family)
MDLRNLDQRALASTGAFVAATSPDQLGHDTPCEGWDVRALLNHVIGGNRLYSAAAAGESADWDTRDGDWIRDDHRSAYDRSVDEVTSRFARLDLAEDRVDLPFGQLPAMHAVAVHFVDVLMHGWDLAVATGQDPTLDPELCEAALQIPEIR